MSQHASLTWRNIYGYSYYYGYSYLCCNRASG
jgi:hypothetical protein